MMPAREDISFILVRTQFASNLGSTVRVMKNMGFENLVLVRPECEVGMEARSYAMKGAEILDNALFLPSLEAATERVGLLVGTTGRFRGERKKLVSSPEVVDRILEKTGPSKVGIVLGSEDNGLRREELRLCQWLVEIPTGSDYPVINLAQAAAIMAYQINLGYVEESGKRRDRSIGTEEFEALMDRIENTLESLDLPTRVSVSRIMLRLKKIIARAQLEREDINMLHGLMRELDKKD